MRASFRDLLALGALILAISGSTALAASEDDEEKPLIDWTFDASPDDTQTSVLALGKDNTWSAAVIDGAYVVKNSTDKDAIRYVHLNLSQDDKPLELSVSSVDVDVDGSFDDLDSGAGILYRFDPQTKTYLAFC